MTDLRLTTDADPGAADDELVSVLGRHRFAEQFPDPQQAADEARALLQRFGERRSLVRVLSGGPATGGTAGEAREVGRVWLVDQGGDPSVLHTALDDLTLAGALRRRLLELAGESGAGRVVVGVRVGDDAARALVSGTEVEVVATHMRLELGPHLPDEDRVVLTPMTEAEHADWSRGHVEAYAEARASAGESAERALEVAVEQFAQLLPEGLATPDQHFLVARARDADESVHGATVGSVWLGTQQPAAFVYDLVIDPAHRRRGYGAAVMRAAALWAHDRGAPALALNVFGHNHAARALYDRLGYAVTEEFLALAVPQQGPTGAR